jgi:tetratricopeptide (TPR) repeat protein
MHFRTATALAISLSVLLASHGLPAEPGPYLSILRQWVSGEAATAAARLSEHLDADDTGIAVSDVARLAADEPDLLLPIIGLHERAHALLLERARSRLGSLAQANQRLADSIGQRDSKRIRTSLQMLRELIEEYLSRVKRRGNEAELLMARARASGFMTCTGVSYRDVNLLEEALVQLQGALDHAPANPTALLVKGAIEEKLGRYKDAAASFERLLLVVPQHHEASLRLALCRRRSGSSGQAAQELEQVTRSEAPAWIRSLAWQELAQLHARQGNREQALATCRHGHEQLPDHDALAMLLLYLLPERSAEAPALLAQLISPERGSRGISPRARYNQWSTEDLTRLRRDLGRTIDEHLPQLRAALPGSGGGS